MMHSDQIHEALLKCLRSVCRMKGIRENDPFNDSTVLIGSEAAILDSLGVVMLAVQLEEELAAVSGSKTFLAQRLLEQDLQEETIGSIVRRIHGMAEARS